ncbi:HelD family protein [Salinicoccus sp. HZC-1]|uniref:HelD family protein n=1 Tax=Salinicoccus sp. HZC-1 TaxID=3385497 RepID=UPI00398B6AE2
MTHLSFEEEKQHLTMTVDFLKAYNAQLTVERDNVKKGIRSSREEINEEIATIDADFESGNIYEFIQMLPELRTSEVNFNFIDTMYNRTKRMIPKPYFGKIVVDGEAVYIGTGTIRNNNNDILIYDWRTPVASLFYENDTGDLSYTIPDGSRIDASVSGRRQFIVEDGRLQKMFDSDVYIGDEVLQNMITDSSQSKLKNIVSTIQQEQNEVIRLPLNQDTLVYGPPGSGKTSLALQRIAFLLYQHKETLKPENILLISPNEVFNDYLSDVLPELGENHVKNITFYRLIGQFPYFKARRFETVYENIRRLRSDPGAHGIYKFKSSLEYFRTLHGYIDSLATGGMEFRDLKDKDGSFISKEKLNDLFYRELAHHTTSKRLIKMRERLLALYTERIEEIKKEKFKELNSQNKYIGEKHQLKETAHSYAKDQLKQTHRQIMLFRFVHIEKLYVNSINDKKFSNATVRSIKENDFKYEDIAPMLYIYIHLLGAYDRSVQHVLIDEVQDYSNMQYYVMRHYYRKASFTSLGDPNQQIHPVEKDPLVAKNHVEKALVRSYRSTNQINAFLNSIVPESIQSVSVDGEAVQKITAEDQVEKIREILRAGDLPQVAIITPSRESADRLHAQLENEFPQFRNLQEEDTLYNQSFIILPYYLSKGFEYNTVIISDAGNYEEDDHIMYVLASRATRHLYIID